MAARVVILLAAVFLIHGGFYSIKSSPYSNLASAGYSGYERMPPIFPRPTLPSIFFSW